MKDSVIFYFSGTGNSLQVAGDLADNLGETELINIADYVFSSEHEPKRIGIVYPVYCWGPPLIVMNFADKIKVPKKAYLFIVATYGGIPGTGLKILKEQFEKRNIITNAAYSIHMPGNCITAYGAFNEKKQQQCFTKEKTAIKRISEDVKNQKTNLKEAKVNPIGTALFKKLYYSMMKDCHGSDKDFNSYDSCKGCGLCERVCPVHNITIEAGRPVWHHKCEGCMACIQHCPQKAIDCKGKTQERKRYLNPNVNFNNK